MRYLYSCSLLIAMLCLCGCPCQTEQSIDDGSYAVPSWLPGTWKEIKTSGTAETIYILSNVKGKTGQMTAYPLDESGAKKEGMPVILSNVGGTIFMNVYEKGDDEMTDKGYYIFRFRQVSDKEFTMTPVKEHKIPYTSSRSEIKAFLESNKDDEEIYEKKDKARYQKK